MQDENILSEYVTAALALQNIELDDVRRAEVEKQFRLLESMAEKFLEEDIPSDIEPAQIFRL